MISTWCGTPNLSMLSPPAGDRLSTTRKAIWRPAIESIDDGKFPGIPAPAAPPKPLMMTGNRTAKIAGWGNRPNSRQEGSTDRGLAGGPDPKYQDGGTGQIAVRKVVPTVAWPVGPILNIMKTDAAH